MSLLVSHRGKGKIKKKYHKKIHSVRISFTHSIDFLKRIIGYK